MYINLKEKYVCSKCGCILEPEFVVHSGFRFSRCIACGHASTKERISPDNPKPVVWQAKDYDRTIKY